MTSDSRFTSLLILLNLSAAFDTVDHHILLYRLQHDIGISGTVLHWLQSHLTGRTEFVALGKPSLAPTLLPVGSPGFCSWSKPFSPSACFPLGRVAGRHRIQFQCCADDTQLYLKVTPTSSPSSSVTHLDSCLEEIKMWMSENVLQLNSSKTEAILIGTPHQLCSSLISSVSFLVHNLLLSPSVTNLGVKV